MFKPYRILFYIGLLSLAVLLFVEPYIRNYYESVDTPILSRILAIWIVLALFVFILNLQQISKDIGLTVGLVTILILIVRAFAANDFVFELLPISYSMIFMCSVIISRRIKITKIDYEKIVRYFVFASCAGMVYANALSFGIVGEHQEMIAEQRYSFVYDGNAAVLAIVIATAAYMYYPVRLLRPVAGIVILLALMRLVSFGSKGPVFTSLIIIFLEVTLFQRKGNRLNGLLLIFGILMLTSLVITIFSPMGAYLDLLLARLDNSDTWLSRLSEAGNDFYAFLERPLLGWGREVPGLNILGETSSGHITITGMLARVGLVGTLGLGFFYMSYFVKLKKYIYSNAKKNIVMKVILIGVLVFVIFLLALGNPLFLFPAWAFLPLLFPAIESTRHEV
ncbi:MAG: hypothetical protein ACXW11_06865 [Methylotenera sp.]